MEYLTDADYFYIPHREDAYFKLYRLNEKNYLAIKPNVYAPGGTTNAMAWRLYPWTKHQTSNFDQVWGVVRQQTTTLKGLDADMIVEPRDAAKELLEYARLFVAKERESEWNKKFPYDAFFEIVRHQENNTFSLALKSMNATDPLFLLPITTYTEYDDKFNTKVKWSIDPHSRSIIPSMANAPYLRKPYVSEEHINVCREIVRQLVPKNWCLQHPEDRKYQICMQNKSFYQQIVDKFPKIRFMVFNQVNALNPNKEERTFIGKLFEPDYAPRHLYIHLLKKRYGTFLAFCPKSVVKEQKEWWVYKINGKGTMMTSAKKEVHNLGSFQLCEKWFWSNQETLAMARNFLQIVHGKKVL